MERGGTFAIIGTMVAIGALILGFLYAILSSLNAQRAENGTARGGTPER